MENFGIEYDRHGEYFTSLTHKLNSGLIPENIPKFYIVYGALSLKVSLTLLEILLCIPCKKYTLQHVLNVLILFTKQFIYLQKKQVKLMVPTLLLRNLKRKCEIEIYLLRTKPNTVSIFLEVWERVLTHVMSLVGCSVNRENTSS